MAIDRTAWHLRFIDRSGGRVKRPSGGVRASNLLARWPCCRGPGSGGVEPDLPQAKGWFGPDVVGWRELRSMDGHDRSSVADRLPIRHWATARWARGLIVALAGESRGEPHPARPAAGRNRHGQKTLYPGTNNCRQKE